LTTKPPPSEDNFANGRSKLTIQLIQVVIVRLGATGGEVLVRFALDQINAYSLIQQSKNQGHQSGQAFFFEQFFGLL
jgi:hypothetical protein